MNYFSPSTTKELFATLNNESNYYILNGGTDLMIQYNQLMLNSDYAFIDISKIKELNYINEDENNVYIGANVKYHQLEENEIIKKYFPSIAYAASEVGSRQIRNLGTIVGNVCNASPGGDLIVILHALEASVVINDEKEMLVSDFVTGFRTNALQDKQVITKLIIPKTRNYNFYQKYGVSHSRKVIISNAGIAASFNIENSKLSNVKIVFGACDIKSREIVNCNEFLNNKSSIDLNEWLSLIDVELNNLCEKKYYDLKIGHLKSCAGDLYDYIIKSLEENHG